jgi:class 3 adenylate cyclase
VTDTVGRFGGFVAKYMGDGVLIYFGYPEAHADDAGRTARAGLAVINALGRLATQERLKVPIGIASGLVVVGDLIGAGASQERGVVGEPPNLAARLQALARPGTLVVADSTRRPLGTLFEIEDLGPPIPLADAAARRSRIVLRGEIPSALFPPGGCPFHTRCHRKIGTSRETQKPVEQRLAQGSHRIVCHIPADELARLTAASKRTAP